MNYFDVLGIKPLRLHVDSEDLEGRFHRLSKETHPDIQGQSEATIERSAHLNDAYRTLRDPWKRAHYVLKLFGRSLGSKVPPCLAPLYFELQESDDRQALEDLHGQLVSGQSLRRHQLEETFRLFDADHERALTLIQELVLENNYALAMLADLERKLSPE